MAREKWIATNQTSKSFCIGDLPRVPTFSPGEGQSHDLLNWHSKDEISKSSDLKSLFDAGWLRLIKKKDLSSQNKSGSNAVSAVTSAEEQEVDDLGVGIASVSEDTSPQLGGNLDVNGNSIKWSREPLPLW